jgi:hypothetical protein
VPTCQPEFGQRCCPAVQPLRGEVCSGVFNCSNNFNLPPDCEWHGNPRC